jgi:hypothetical protein
VLITGRCSDDFDFVANDPFDTGGMVPTCRRSVVRGDTSSPDQWGTLTDWHVGLSCQTYLHPKHVIIMKVGDHGFMDEFSRPRPQIRKVDGRPVRTMLVYRLCRGMDIPEGVGVERAGDVHATMFPVMVETLRAATGRCCGLYMAHSYSP